jgi:predicted DNA-binding transcriptional regulator AlpA
VAKRVTKAEAEALALSLGPNMMNYADVARLLRLSVRTVKRMTAEGVIPSPDLRLSRVVRWRPATIQRWLDEHSPRRSRSAKGGG